MTAINESLTFVVESDGDAPASDEFPIQLITPGWGSSGYYSEQVLENAVADRIWPKGTHIYFDHPGMSEQMDRPVRSVRDLAAVLSEDAYSAGGGVIRGKAKPVGPYKDLLLDQTFQEAVGMSIRADGDLTEGEAAGRRGSIVTRLTSSTSVDIVSKAGRGGRILPLMESAGIPARVAEATTDDTRDRLERGLRELLGRDADFYLREFDPEARLAYVRVFDTGQRDIQSAPYTLADNSATFGPMSPVRAVTTYVPLSGSEDEVVEHSGTSAGTDTLPSEEDTQMTTKQIEEAELSQLQERASKVEEAETRATTAETRASSAELRATALQTIMESGHRFNKLEVSGLLGDLPVTESGTLDADKFKTTLDESATAYSGSGGVRSMGGDSLEEGAGASMDDFDEAFSGRKG